MAAGNAIGFALSAQVNFLLSRYITWRDRRRAGRRVLRQWLQFNATMIAALGLNSAVFVVAVHVAPRWLAALAGIGAGAALTFALSASKVFAPGEQTGQQSAPTAAARTPANRSLTVEVEGLEQPQPVGLLEGVAVVMPAYTESKTLPQTVQGVLGAADVADVPCTVVVADDGGPDGTPQVASDLVRRYPGRVVVAHHRDLEGQPFNQGYGQAVRSALETGLSTGRRHVVLVDADCQFCPDDLLAAYALAVHERLEVVFGYRTRRADPLKRRLMGKGWTWFSRLWTHYWIRDVDCAVKVFLAPVLAEFSLCGGYAAISPELVAWSRAVSPRIGQIGVRHLPRMDQELQTGANLNVVLGSFRSSADVYRNMVRHGLRWRRVPRRPDHYVTTAAVLLSLGFFAYYLRRNLVLANPDAVAHLLIAGRVLHNPTSHLGQLGGVWLPLPHLLMLPFAWNKTLYRSGMAGSAISMISYALTARWMYKIGKSLTNSTPVGIGTALVFMLNPNVLYMQSTPMTELPMLAAITAGVYYLLRWSQTDDFRYLIPAAFAAMVVTLVRYEGWIFLFGMTSVLVYSMVRKHYNRSKIEAHLVLFTVLAGVGIFLWMVWNQIIFGDWLYFQRGNYAKPSLWTSRHEFAVGHLGTSIKTFSWATVDNLGWAASFLLVAGLGLFVYRTRLRPETAAPMALLPFFPFFVFAVYTGQRPLHVAQLGGSWYNVRFGLVMVPAAAVFTGYLVDGLTQRGWGIRILAGVLGVAVLASLLSSNPTTLREGQAYLASTARRNDGTAAQWLVHNYSGGHVLLENFGNEGLLFAAGIPLQDVVYEGSYRLWSPALRAPHENGIRWIYMRQSPGNQDKVYLALHGSDELRNYELVFRDPDRLIYELPAEEQRPALVRHRT